MKIMTKLLILGLCACLTIPTMMGCEEKGPAEKAGEKIDEAMEEAGDAMEDAADSVEEAGEKIEEKMN